MWCNCLSWTIKRSWSPIMVASGLWCERTGRRLSGGAGGTRGLGESRQVSRSGHDRKRMGKIFQTFKIDGTHTCVGDCDQIPAPVPLMPVGSSELRVVVKPSGSFRFPKFEMKYILAYILSQTCGAKSYLLLDWCFGNVQVCV